MKERPSSEQERSGWSELLWSYARSSSCEFPSELFWRYEKLVAAVARRYPSELYSPTGEANWTRDALDTVTIDTLTALIKNGVFRRLHLAKEPSARIQAYLSVVIRRELRVIYERRHPVRARFYERIARVLREHFVNVHGHYWALREWEAKTPVPDAEVDARLSRSNLPARHPGARGGQRLADDVFCDFLRRLFALVNGPVRLGKIVSIGLRYFETPSHRGPEDDDSGTDPGFAVAAFGIDEVAAGFVSKLTDRQLKVFLLYFIEDQTLQNIASLLGCSTGTAGNEKQRLDSLLGELRKYFTEQDGERLFAALKNRAELRHKAIQNERRQQEASNGQPARFRS